LASVLPLSAASDSSLTCNPQDLQFGTVTLGSSSTLPAAITNRGSATITIADGAAVGAEFSLRGIAFPLTLQPGESFTFNISFAPMTSGTVNGSIDFSGSHGVMLNVPLMGNAAEAGKLVDSPDIEKFGNVPVGKKSQRTATLSAVGGSVTVSSAHSNNTEFTTSGLRFPLTIAAGQNVNYYVIFQPQKAGKTSGLLSFRSDADNGVVRSSLDGNGTAPKTYTVNLSWEPSSSQVIGYNVFRGTQSGGPYSMINSTVDPDTSYVDNGAEGGEIYYYVTTAVNSNGQQSGYSNQAVVQVP
jgi:trimeric autotransporter adhesin